MPTSPFNASAWQGLCQAAYDRCGKQAQTRMHHLYLFSISLDEALAQLDGAHQGLATSIARGFGYEPAPERMDFGTWFGGLQADLQGARI